jgi:IMP dehydrogenase
MLQADLGEFLTYDDVLILPNFSSIGPYDGNVRTKVSKNVSINIPIVSSPMDTVTEAKMAIALAKLGGLGIVHRNMSLEAEVAIIEAVKHSGCTAGAAVGAFDHERALALEQAGCDVILIDAAHAMKLDIIESARELKKKLKCDLICGSIATEEGAQVYSEFADGLRVGVGPGSICTMRIVTGVGVPQLTAVSCVASIAQSKGVPVIADGGIRTSGDIAKSVAAGANCVMLGNLLAGLEESPGELVSIDGKTFKQYRGMGSSDVLNGCTASDRYEQDTNFEKISMGVSGLVPYQGALAGHINQLVGGLRAAMGLVGAADLKQMYEQSKFIKISSAAFRESHPHTLAQYKKESNYE